MDEVRSPTKGEDPVVETVDAPTLEATQAAEQIPQEQEETGRGTVLISKPSSPASTVATAIAAGRVKAETQVRSTHEDEHEIMLMLEKTMEKVCKWREWIEAQNSATA
jgi:D-alanyl-D-alanine carboxypeptidase